MVQEALDALDLAADAKAIDVMFIDHALPEPVAVTRSVWRRSSRTFSRTP